MTGNSCASDCETVTLGKGLASKPELVTRPDTYRMLEWEQRKQQEILTEVNWVKRLRAYIERT